MKDWLLEAGGGAMVHHAPVPGATDARAALVADDAPALLAAGDPTLWGPDAESESKIRLGWVDTFTRSRELLPRLAALRASLVEDGLDHVVLAGMGGSSLAPEVICATLGRPLTVLDTTDPAQIRTALGDRLDRTVVVVSSKSGSTVETDSQRRAYLAAFTAAGVAEPHRRFVLVTDPGPALAAVPAREVFLADPNVGGRYSALTAFGLVPAALAGVNVAELLDEAEEFAKSLVGAEDNPALALGAALGASGRLGRDKIVLLSDGSGFTGFGDWAEQLLAESTGKLGRGLLPVVVEEPSAVVRADDSLVVTVGGALGVPGVSSAGLLPDVAVNGSLGAQFLLWEFATALAGRILEINPFDQPNVAESKANTARILADGQPAESPTAVDGPVEIYGSGATLVAALRGLVAEIPDHGYLAIMTYLDRLGDAPIARLRRALADATPRAVTFGWGPRFLHSTGQYHKGGPQDGAFLQITGVVDQDLPIPDQAFSFGTLQAAQAAGDREALAGRGRPVLRLHLTDRDAGVAAILAAALEVGADG